jgi:hypothetical protein
VVVDLQAELGVLHDDGPLHDGAGVEDADTRS